MEVQQRDRDGAPSISAMQVETESRAVLQVQRRERDGSAQLGNGVGYKFIEDRSNGDNKSSSSPRRSGLRPRRRWLDAFSKAGDFITSNPTRSFLVAAVCLTVLLLVLLTRDDDGSSSCKQNAAQEVSYPAVELDKVKPLKDKARFAALKAENWIVLSVTGPPTEEVKAMVKLQGWHVVAIGDSETPTDWLVPGAIFLDTDLQGTFHYRITKLLPYNSYVRKSVGYLFAIQHGALRIYDADSHSIFVGGHLGRSFDIDLATTKTLLQFRSFKNRTVVNPFVHFGQRSVWPRGLSLTTVPKISPEVTYDEVHSGSQFIQQGLANGLPDVDSVFYHSRRLAGEPINIEFDHLAPTVSLPEGTMAPINSINTLFHSPAFWALLLPVGVHPGVADIIRGYWAQRLLWEVGGKVTFYPPSILRVDTLQGPIFEDEEDMLHDWEQLIDFLVSWRSTKRSFFERVLDLSYQMAVKEFWTREDLELTVAWLQDLVSVGYKPPDLQPLQLDTSTTAHHRTRQFLPQIFKSSYPGVDDASTVEKEMGHLIRWRGFFDNVVLILECEWPLNHTVPAWRMLYGRLFKHVVVLSTEADPTLDVEAGAGWQTYTALPRIFDRYPSADGYLYVKDHAILNYWNLVTANKSKLWTMHGEKESWKVHSFNDTGPEWYFKSSFKRTVKKTIYNLPDKLKAIYRQTMDDNYFIRSTSDFFYIPQRFVGDFKDLASVGVQNKLGHELAMPVFLLSMDTPSQFDTKAFSQVVYVPEGQRPSSHYSIDVHVIYPWKASTEADLFHILKSMSLGDHLLLAAL